MVRPSACEFCARLTDAMAMTCEAFPDGVPPQIIGGEDLHLTPVEGDNGLLFKPKSTEAAAEVAQMEEALKTVPRA